jgi:DNA topoisomerase-1
VAQHNGTPALAASGKHKHSTSLPSTDHAADPVDSARAAGLRYVHGGAPGIRRLRSGKGFRYVNADGRAVRDPETLGRIRSLAIPPAWTDV